MNAIDPVSGRLSPSELERLQGLSLEEMSDYLSIYIAGVANGLRDQATPADAFELRDELHDVVERYLGRLRAKVHTAREIVAYTSAPAGAAVHKAIEDLEMVIAERESMLESLMQSLTEAASSAGA